MRTQGYEKSSFNTVNLKHKCWYSIRMETHKVNDCKETLLIVHQKMYHEWIYLTSKPLLNLNFDIPFSREDLGVLFLLLSHVILKGRDPWYGGVLRISIHVFPLFILFTERIGQKEKRWVSYNCKQNVKICLLFTFRLYIWITTAQFNCLWPSGPNWFAPLFLRVLQMHWNSGLNIY